MCVNKFTDDMQYEDLLKQVNVNNIRMNKILVVVGCYFFRSGGREIGKSVLRRRDDMATSLKKSSKLRGFERLVVNPIFDKRLIMTDGYVKSGGLIMQRADCAEHDSRRRTFSNELQQSVEIPVPGSLDAISSWGSAGQVSKIKRRSLVCRGYASAVVYDNETAPGKGVSSSLSLFSVGLKNNTKKDIQIKGLFESLPTNSSFAIVKIADIQDELHPIVYYEDSSENSTTSFATTVTINVGVYIVTAEAYCYAVGHDEEGYAQFRFELSAA